MATLEAEVAALRALVMPKRRLPSRAALAMFDALTGEVPEGRAFTSAQVVDGCMASAPLRRAVCAVARPGRSQAQRVGRVLAGLDDHVRHGIRLRRLTDAEHVRRWVFEVVQGD